MVRPVKSVQAAAPQNPELQERNRRKKLAFTKRTLSEWDPKPNYSLGPSKTVLKHHGKDIIKKSHRKNRYLFSFPGLLAPVSGGKIGELKDLGSKNPVLYLDFPQGRMKLFGTIVYPKNRYLTLQFSRGGKNVMCEDYFYNMIVFTDAWWIGKKEDNPEEVCLEFPKEMVEEPHVEHDFRGGAAESSIDKPVANKAARKREEKASPETELEEEASDDDINILKTATTEVTPVRHSERNSGKKFRFIESSPEEDSLGIDGDADVKEKNSTGSVGPPADGSVSRMDGGSILELDDTDYMDDVKKTEENPRHILSAAKGKCEDASQSSQGPLVQTTISSLFKKAGEKKVSEYQKTSSPGKVSAKKTNQANLKRKIEFDDGPKKKSRAVKGKGAGTNATKRGKVHKVDDDDMEEISTSFEGSNGSSEEWAA